MRTRQKSHDAPISVTDVVAAYRVSVRWVQYQRDLRRISPIPVDIVSKCGFDKRCTWYYRDDIERALRLYPYRKRLTQPQLRAS